MARGSVLRLRRAHKAFLGCAFACVRVNKNVDRPQVPHGRLACAGLMVYLTHVACWFALLASQAYLQLGAGGDGPNHILGNSSNKSLEQPRKGRCGHVSDGLLTDQADLYLTFVLYILLSVGRGHWNLQPFLPEDFCPKCDSHILTNEKWSFSHLQDN
eukprot:2101818-Amphidinium_carterae.1